MSCVVLVMFCEFFVHVFLFCLLCVALFCLFCSVLFGSVLFFSVLFWSGLFFSAPFCSVLFSSALFCSVLFLSVLFCSLCIFFWWRTTSDSPKWTWLTYYAIMYVQWVSQSKWIRCIVLPQSPKSCKNPCEWQPPRWLHLMQSFSFNGFFGANQTADPETPSGGEFFQGHGFPRPGHFALLQWQLGGLGERNGVAKAPMWCSSVVCRSDF